MGQAGTGRPAPHTCSPAGPPASGPRRSTHAAAPPTADAAGSLRQIELRVVQAQVLSYSNNIATFPVYLHQVKKLPILSSLFFLSLPFPPPRFASFPSSPPPRLLLGNPI
ncbi:hypothetical protein E2C01_076210 [Portunus trituberculatus]|uniref:Uncharacterized protein n=1 Tax=Portunus trituberculatus TaxID=210409 RepID=A0A5B7IH90_PORTR|nr:hypothetical protein [Portunus trituberculatus]